jgi:Ran GTPase-activating protein (RanGAP) involved in mRNA processing and transport
MTDNKKQNTNIRFLSKKIKVEHKEKIENVYDSTNWNEFLKDKEYVCIPRNDIRSEECKHISKSLEKNTSLKTLSLKLNLIGNEGCGYIFEALKINNSLSYLNLKYSFIGNEGCKYISESLKRNTSLKKLSLKGNNIGDKGCKHISEALKNNNSLQKLDFRKNFTITSLSCTYFLEALKFNTSLQKLDLSWAVEREQMNAVESMEFISDILKQNIKKSNDNKELLLMILLCRSFQSENLFSKDYLPLDMLKTILKEAGILFILPKK